MQNQFRRSRILSTLAAAALLFISSWALADPPSRVGRLGYTVGNVSFSPAGEDDWVKASVNRPLTTGDRLWSDARARAEIQVGGAAIRLNSNTGLSVLNLDDRIVQLQLTEGTLNVRVRRLAAGQLFEVDTPNLAFVVRQAGEYRIAVDGDGNATTIIVRKGKGEAYGDNDSYVVDTSQPYRFSGTDLRDYEYVDAPRYDEFDTWAAERDRRYDNSTSARYVSQDVIGYQDLDANGSWRSDPTYGQVWYPSRVAAGWAPYRDGHWTWIDPWGWTWVDDAPWGFAVSHYGRWANLRGTWGWVPGPVQSRAYYAPALVAFIGGNNFHVTVSSESIGGVAWFPLAPREVYRPAYTTSRGYFENINRSNTVVNTTVINNYYNNSNVTNVVYANRQVTGAVIAVPVSTFVQSQPVARAAVRVTRDMNVNSQPAFVAPVAPTQQSVRGAADQGSKPPGRGFERRAVARTAPPAVRASFAAQQSQLAVRPGKPLDDAERKQLKPVAAVPAPVVKVVAQPQVAPPTARPPRPAPGASAGKGNNGRGNGSDRNIAPAPPVNTAPAPAPATAPNAVAPVQEQQRGRSDQRGRGESRAPAPPPVAPTKTAPPVAPPVEAAPKVVPAASAAPPEQRGRGAQRGNPESRQAPQAPPPAPAAQPSQPAAAPVAPKAAPPAAPPAEARGRGEQRGKPESRAPAQPSPAPPPPVAAPAQAAPPAAPAPENRGRGEARGRSEQRGQPESAPPRQEQPRAVPAPKATPAPAPAPAAAPAAEPQAKPAPGRDRKKDKDEQDKEEEKRKRKD